MLFYFDKKYCRIFIGNVYVIMVWFKNLGTVVFVFELCNMFSAINCGLIKENSQTFLLLLYKI